LADALAQLQTELPAVKKDQTARVPTKSGGEYSYTYAGLPALSEAVLPLMGRLGLSFSAKPTWTEESGFVLRYMLRHSPSNQFDTGDWPLPDPRDNTNQAIGSAITYGRRYILSALTGVAADEDDDAQVARDSDAYPSRSRQRREPEPPETKTDAEWLVDAQEAVLNNDESALLAIGRQVSAAGQWQGELKDQLLALRAKLLENQQKQETPPAQPDGVPGPHTPPEEGDKHEPTEAQS
jgi:hypothetical protein